MPSLRCISKGRRWSKKILKKTSSNDCAEDDETEGRYILRRSQNSSFVLCGEDIVINVTKQSKKRMSGLELEKQGQSLVVRRVLEGSLFAKTALAPDMELRVINGVQCSKLDHISEAYEIIGQAEGAVTIVVRERRVGEETDDPSQPIQPPNQWSSGAAHMWLEMTQFMIQRKDTPQPLSPPPKQEYCLRKGELRDEDIEAPPAPKFKKTSRPKALPSKLEMDNKSSLHSAMSEITLNPSQHQTSEPADIVVTRAERSKFEKRHSSVKLILAELYPDYDGEEEEDILSCAEKSSNESQATEDVSLTPTSLVREESPSHLHRIDVSPPSLDDDDDDESSSASFRRASHMISHSLHPPSIPRVGG